MTYYEAPGVLLDVAYFLAFYYNEEYILNRIACMEKKVPIDSFSNYLNMKPLMNPLPEHLHLFAYSSDKTCSLITTVVYQRNFENLSYQGFLGYLASEQFKMDAYHHWFGLKEKPLDIKELDSLDITQLAAGLLIPEEMKYKLILTAQNFETRLTDFIDLFKNIYDAVIKIRKKHESLIESCKDRYDNLFFYRSISEKMNMDVTNFSYTFTYVNQRHFYFSTDHSFLYIGVQFLDSLNVKKETSMNSFAYIYDNPVRVQIIDYVNRCGPVYKYDIYEHLNMNKEMVYYQVDLLCAEGIILRAIAQDGGRTKFLLNQEYFKSIPKVFLAAFEQITNNSEEKNLG